MSGPRQRSTPSDIAFTRNRRMDSEISYFVVYSCPYCKAELEAQDGGWQGGLRCPAGGRPSLPPESLFGRAGARRRVEILAGNDADDILVIGTSTQDRRAPDRLVPASSHHISAPRLIFTTGFAISLFLLLIAFLDQNTQN